ncbi:hypothetical protein SANTM175S_01611 [Streptomyces antimycoticus]
MVMAANPVLPAREDLQLGEREDDDDPEEHVRHRRGVAEPVVGEAGVVDVLQDRPGGPVRAAFGQQIDLVEHLQRRHHLQHRDQRGGPAQLGEGDRPQPAPRTGAVERGRLVEVVGDRLQRGQVEQEVESHRPPQGHQPDGPHRVFLVRQPGDPVHPERLEHAVEHPPVRLEQHAPDLVDHRHRQQMRGEEGQPPQPLPRHPRVHQQGHHQGDDHEGDGGQDGEPDRVAEGLPHLAVAERLGVVVQADEDTVTVSGQAGVGEAHPQADADRHEEEEREEHQEGGGEEPPGAARGPSPVGGGGPSGSGAPRSGRGPPRGRGDGSHHIAPFCDSVAIRPDSAEPSGC